MDNISKTEQKSNSSEDGSSPLHRPMNAFFIFCKHYRGTVREKYPHLENRAITKILGELWAKLEQSKKALFTQLAKQYKDAFMKAHPDFKWYKLPASRAKRFVRRHSYNLNKSFDCGITLGKLVDDEQLGGLSSLIKSAVTPKYTSMNLNEAANIAMPLKKRYIINGEFQQSSEEPSMKDRDFQTQNACSALLELGEICPSSVHDKVKSSPAIRKDENFLLMKPSELLPVQLEVSTSIDSTGNISHQTEEIQQDQPLDLCKHKNSALIAKSRYITTSQQQLIEHFVDKFLSDAPVPQANLSESEITYSTICKLSSDKITPNSLKINEVKPAFTLSFAIESAIDKMYNKDDSVLRDLYTPESTTVLDHVASTDDKSEKEQQGSEKPNLFKPSEENASGHIQSSVVTEKEESSTPDDVKSILSKSFVFQKKSFNFNSSKSYKTLPTAFKTAKPWCSLLMKNQMTQSIASHRPPVSNEADSSSILPSRSSERTCKGRRYQALLTDGFLLSHKKRKQNVKPKPSLSNQTKNFDSFITSPKTLTYYSENKTNERK